MAKKIYNVLYARGKANKKVGFTFAKVYVWVCVCVLRQDEIPLTEQCTAQVKEQLPRNRPGGYNDASSYSC